MKQSTKLLSMLLAVLMAFSCLSVVGSAALDKKAITYDIIDDADLTYEQVSTLALDLVDNDLLAGMDTIDLSIVGKLRLDSIDHILADIHSLRTGFVWTIGKGLLGDVGDLDFSGLTVEDKNNTALQRSNGDYAVISGLLLFIGENAGTLSKAAYGLSGGDGISLGLISSFLDLGEIGDMLNDIPSMLVGLVFDLLVYGSYGYDMDVEDIKDADTTLTAKYPEMDTLDEMLPNVLYNLLTKPQDYEWVGEGEASEKVWDMDSVIMPGLTLSAADINPLSKSLFQLLDVAAQIAIDEIAIPALNNNLKKALMLAVEADLNEIDYATLPADVAAVFDNTEEYVTYFAYDKIKKSGGIWYYTTLESEVTIDPTTGEPALDEEGNEISEKVRKYFKVNMGAANEFASLINWDWDFVKSDVTPGANQTALIYDDIIAVNGSIVGGINTLLGMVYDVALTDAAKADYVEKIQLIDPSLTGWIDDNGNDDLTLNVEYLTKYILTEFGDKVFGEDSAYANYKWEDVQDLSVIDLVAMIGPKFFEDAMPQIILPKNADGTYAFHEGVQVWEFAAVVIRELCTGIAPIVNYDAYIFENGDVTSAKDRTFVEQDADAWFNIILNMGTDVGLVYLQQITNFQDFLDDMYGDGTYLSFDMDTSWLNLGDTTDGHWKTSLNAAILWAVDYVGSQRSTGVLNGITYDAVNAYADPLDKLSYILNTILPLGFVGDGTYTSPSFDLDLNLVADGLKNLLTYFDLNTVLHLLGRNQESSYNMLDDASLGTAVLDLVNHILNLVFRKTILQGVNARTSGVTAQSLDNVISKASLKTTVNNLLGGLSSSRDAILKNALPVVGKLIKGWGTEQRFQTPKSNIGDFIVVGTSGTTFWYQEEEVDCEKVNVHYSSPITVAVRNDSDGLWRHYRDANGAEHKDEHYKIQLVDVQFYNYDGSATSYVNDINVNTSVVDYGGSTSYTFNVGSIKSPDGKTSGTGAVIPNEGVVQKVKMGYKVYIEDGSALLNSTTFYEETYIWLSRYAREERNSYSATSDCYEAYGISPTYVPYYEDDLQATLDYVKGMDFGSFVRNEKTLAGADASFSFTATASDADGFTIGSTTASCNKNANLETIPLRVFDTYSGSWYEVDTTTSRGSYSVNGKVPTVDVFKQNVPMSEVDSAAGASSTWSVALKAKDNTGSGPLVLKYYNADYRDMLIDLVQDEDNAQRVASDYKHYYNANATVEASEALINVDVPASESESGEFELRQTNFAVGANGVTVINCAQAWTNYYNALQPALRAALQEWNPVSVYNFRELYNALRVAVNDLEFCAATADDGAATLGTSIDALESQLRAAQARTTDKYNYTDYKMHRLNRFNDARDDANWYITLKDDASPANITYIDEYFGYSWMEENDFRELVGAHTVAFGDKAGTSVAENEYKDYLLALLEQFDEEEIASKKEWLASRKKEYASLVALDLAMASNYLTLTENRLLKRNSNKEDAITKQLDDEIVSAQNMIGTSNNGRYTDGSWKNYIEAYNTAVEAQTSGSQKQVFDAKYNLLVQRKNLVLADEAGDYAELNALIGYAQFALEHTYLYNNSNKEFGQVLAELGMDTIINSDGYEVQLFPGSALLTVDRAYGADDQDEIDDAAEALKEALARLEFKGLKVLEKPTNKVVDSEILVEADEVNDVEEITALVSHIAKDQGEADVKNYFTVNATNANVTVDDIIVTNDRNYSVSYDGAEAFTGFAGTNSTVTFYTTYKTADGNVKLPVATVKLVVDGDLNGDGAVDVLDAAYGALVAAEKGELEGCYLLAADLVDSDRAVKDADYQQIVNKVVA